MSCKNNKDSDDKKSKQPQEEMVNHWIAFFVVNIIFRTLFDGTWWAVLPVIILLITSIEKTVKFLQNKEARENYLYKTTQEEMIHYWIATIIVSIIMNTIFHGIWFSQIPCTVLIIKSLETTYTFIKAQKIRRNENLEKENSQQYQYYVYEEESQPDVQYDSAIYCQMCGLKKQNSDSNYCPSCGAPYRVR
ncbi:MAG: hypothetical protein ACTSWX_14085 [Promethearchaeota archaeon]